MSIGKKLIRLILLVGLMALSARISFDINLPEESIPITAQSLAVLFICIFLSPFEAILVTALYLAAGVAGLPVFAEGSSGMEKLIGPTGGYLYGFVISGFCISLLGRAGFRKNFFLALLAMLMGTGVLLLVGTIHLSEEHGFQKALDVGFSPFWKAGVIKSLMGAFLVVFVEKGFKSKAKRSIKI